MKKLTVIVAGLGFKTLERRNVKSLAGLTFEAQESVFPALTSPAQATLRTGLQPSDHKIFANAFWSDSLQKPLFWEQSAALVKGARVWDDMRARGEKVGLFFFQQSLGENCDVIISPAPIHKHNGGMIMSCYTKPTGAAKLLEDVCGKFPLWRYWGPLASPRVGRACIKWFERATDILELDEAYLYLPTLDYAAQKYGPDSSQDVAAFKELRYQLEKLANICQKRSCDLSVIGDYEITPVSLPPQMPNYLLRKKGFFKVRTIGARAYPDFFQSEAFAMCDHEIAYVYGSKRDEATKELLSTGDYSELPSPDPRASLLLAKKGSWCDYRWWVNKKEAPDFASHVDIHNKPGYDPHELFFFCRGTVKGTHGRQTLIAKSI